MAKTLAVIRPHDSRYCLHRHHCFDELQGEEQGVNVQLMSCIVDPTQHMLASRICGHLYPWYDATQTYMRHMKSHLN